MGIIMHISNTNSIKQVKINIESSAAHITRKGITIIIYNRRWWFEYNLMSYYKEKYQQNIIYYYLDWLSATEVKLWWNLLLYNYEKGNVEYTNRFP